MNSPPHPPATNKRLTASNIPVSRMTRALTDDAFALFQDAYTGADRARFERDLNDKQTIILLRDRATGQLRGFSTVRIERVQAPRRATVVFSGDTVIHRDYWGQKQLQVAFARLLLAQKLRAPHRPLYWFLISKGYRTYMLLANAFPRAVPRHDRPHDPVLRASLDALARERFGAQYDPATSIVRLAGQHEHVREGLAPILARHLANPHVCFFVARNPNHASGDELACLADVRLVDMARIGARLACALARLALGARRARGTVPLGTPTTESA